MSDGQWIVIPNWDRFQHYRDRRPVWIKLYTELADKDEWIGLTMHQRGVLVSIWLAYASSGGQVSVRSLSGNPQLGLRVSSVQLEALRDAGFIELSASRPLATRARAREGAREEKEKETPKSPLKTNRRTTGWRLVRGSHGQTLIPDPNGTDKPPAEARP